MKKIIIIAVIILGIIIYFLFGHPSTSPPLPPNNGFPIVEPLSPPEIPSPDKETFIIPTLNGNITVNNFLRNATNYGDGVYEIIATGKYAISYFAPHGSFQIGLLERPVSRAREEAENSFLEILGTTKEDACKLDVLVGMPYFVEPTLAGKDFNLSFCSDGIPF